MYTIKYVMFVLRLYAHAKEKKIMKVKEALPIMGISRKALYEWKKDYYNDPSYQQIIFDITNDKKFNNNGNIDINNETDSNNNEANDNNNNEDDDNNKAGDNNIIMGATMKMLIILFCKNIFQKGFFINLIIHKK